MKIKRIITKTITFLILCSLLGPIFNFEISEASIGYSDIYPRLGQSEKDEVSEAMFWLYDLHTEFHYGNKYKQSSVIFSAMEQSNANFHNKNFEYSWDHNARTYWEPGSGDPLGAFEAYDKGESNGVDWYLKNFWNIKPTRSKVLVNGKDVKFEAYNIQGNNYFKLRDLALALNGTSSSFEVGWNGDKNAINLVLGKEYTPAGGEVKVPENLKLKEAVLSSSKIFLNGKEVDLTAYTMEGNNYFKLRDLGDALGFIVDWDQKESTIIINSK